jgi:hypothetical protein
MSLPLAHAETTLRFFPFMRKPRKITNGEPVKASLPPQAAEGPLQPLGSPQTPSSNKECLYLNLESARIYIKLSEESQYFSSDW